MSVHVYRTGSAKNIRAKAARGFFGGGVRAASYVAAAMAFACAPTYAQTSSATCEIGPNGQCILPLISVTGTLTETYIPNGGPLTGVTAMTIFYPQKPPAQDNSGSRDADSSCNGRTPATSPRTGRPVVIATGEKQIEESDFRHASLNPLSLDRYYSSKPLNPAYDEDTFGWGANWRGGLFFPKLEYSSGCRDVPGWSWAGCVPDYIILTMPSGARYSFGIYNMPMYFPSGSNGSGGWGTLARADANTWRFVIDGATYDFSPATKK